MKKNSHFKKQEINPAYHKTFNFKYNTLYYKNANTC